MDTLIAYWWRDMFKPFDQDPGEIEWQRAATPEANEAAGRAQ
jgi:hypothetical protein